MSNRFEFDGPGLERAVKKAADAEVRKIGAQFERSLNSLSRSDKGKPIADVKRRVRSEFGRIGIKASEKELDDYARAIADGERIEVKYT